MHPIRHQRAAQSAETLLLFPLAVHSGEDFEPRNCTGLPNTRSNTRFIATKRSVSLKRQAFATCVHAIAKWKRPTGYGVATEGIVAPAQTIGSARDVVS
jgi:hypothetical protein